MNMDESKARSGSGSFYLQIFLVSLLGLSLLGNVLLGWKVKSINQDASIRSSYYAQSIIGTKIGQLNVINLSGEKTLISLADRQPTILYIFRPHCKWCGLNLPEILSLNQQRGSQFRFIGISTTADDLKPYLNKSPLPFPVYVASSPEEVAKLHVVGTPQTIEISRDGKVEQNWIGVYEHDTATSIEKQLQVKLTSLALQ